MADLGEETFADEVLELGEHLTMYSDVVYSIKVNSITCSCWNCTLSMMSLPCYCIEMVALRELFSGRWLGSTEWASTPRGCARGLVPTGY